MNVQPVSSSLSRRTFIALGGAATAGVFWPSSSQGVGTSQASALLTAQGGNWVHTATTEAQVFDDQLVRYFVEHFEGFNYRGVLTGVEPRYDYTSVVGRIKDLNPELPVLMYSQGSLFIRQNPGPRNSIEQHVLAGYEDLGDLLMPEWPQGDNNRFWGDPRNPAFRDWLVQRISTWVDDMGVDGVFLDVWRMFAALPIDPEEAIAYADGMKQLTTDVVQSLGTGRLVMFNGLWYNIQPGMFDAQLEGLPLASAAMIEYFGFDPARGRQAPVELFLPIPAQFPDKTLMFSGRGLRSYESYEADYLRQRYDYAAYLLAAGDHAYFKYNATFQLPGGFDAGSRTGAEAVYSDWFIELGDPQGLYEELDGLLVREFAHGLVALNPEPAPGEPGQSQILTLTRPKFDPEGEVYHGSVPVEPGVGLLLLDHPAPARPVVRIDLSASDAPGGDWPWASRETGYLHLDTTPAGEEWEHDLLLDTARSLSARTRLRALIRTDDPNARLEIEVEVDDAQGTQSHAIVAVGTEPAEPGTPPESAGPIPYRLSPDAARRRGFRDDWQSFTANTAITADGEWHTVKADIPAVLGAGAQYVPRRLAHMRLVGSMDISKVRLLT